MNGNPLRFCDQLEQEYIKLFKTEEYAYSASKMSPRDLAVKMTLSLKDRTANKDGDGIKRTCKALGIKYSYTAIYEYLS